MPTAATLKKRTVRQFVAGSPTAFRTIYDVYQDKLFAYCLKFTKSVPDAEELVQQSFVRLWEHRHRVDPRRPLDPYVYRIARNGAFDYLKERARTAQFKADLQMASSSAYQHEPAADYEKMAQDAIDTLPEKRQIIFRMSYDDGMTHQEIADTLRLSVHTVKSQLAKATKTLRLTLLRHVGLYLLLLFGLG